MRGLPQKAVLIIIFLSAFFANARAAEIRNIDFKSGPGVTAVVVRTSAPVQFSYGRLQDPERLYMDFRGIASWRLGTGADADELAKEGGLVRKVRIGRFDSRTVRLVFELGKNVNAKIIKRAGPDEISIEFSNGSGPGKAAQTRPAINPARFSSSGLHHKWRIVIDAGHGGHDPGAMSKDGLEEKDITLRIAKRLAALLEKDPHYDVKLTRDKDVYLTLEERTQIANRFNADLFVSIHINSSPRPNTRGIETYFLNFTDDEEANRVAARENQISLRRMKRARTELGTILASLELQGKRDESLKLAHYIDDSISKSLDSSPFSGEPNLGVRQALFYVLVGAKMPSVLTEISFISNRHDESLLEKDEYLDDVSRGLARGIGSFLNEIPPQDIAQR